MFHNFKHVLKAPTFRCESSDCPALFCLNWRAISSSSDGWTEYQSFGKKNNEILFTYNESFLAISSTGVSLSLKDLDGDLDGGSSCGCEFFRVLKPFGARWIIVRLQNFLWTASILINNNSTQCNFINCYLGMFISYIIMHVINSLLSFFSHYSRFTSNNNSTAYWNRHSLFGTGPELWRRCTHQGRSAKGCRSCSRYLNTLTIQ